MNRETGHVLAGSRCRVRADAARRSTRRTFLFLATAWLALLTSEAALAQATPRLYRIGYLAGGSETSSRQPLDIFRATMRDFGYVEGRNLVIELRYAEGRYERYAALAVELVQLKLDVIVSTGGTTATRALQQATRSIPIVITAGSDPVAMGFAASLARPGGNITGLTTLTGDLNSKRLELLYTAVPKLAHVAVLMNPDNVSHPANLKHVESAARMLRIKVSRTEARSAEELDQAFATLARERVGAVIVLDDSFFNNQAQRIAALASTHRLPSMTPQPRLVEAGSFISYGQELLERYRRSATYVDKILKGAKPGDLPIEQPTKFELVINLKTAKALGIKVPQSLLLQATRAIE